MSCHSDPNTTRTSDGKSLVIDLKKYKASVHGEVSVACTDCHADLATADMPHAEKLQKAQCASCHEAAVKGFAHGIHSKTRKDNKGPNATCQGCHGGAHEILASGDRRSPTHHLNQIQTCATCHEDHNLIEKGLVPKGIVPGFRDSIHGRGVRSSGLTVAPTCTGCHGAHDVLQAVDPQSPVSPANQSAMCGKCHEGITEKYDVSIHAQKLKEKLGQPRRPGEREAPTCATCHSAHRIPDAHLGTWELDVTKECGTCHKESIESYHDSFHGSVTALGFARMAKCADCHGAHDIVGSKDPRSPVHGDNLMATCKKCHENANAGFVAFDPHAQPQNRERNPILFYAWVMMQVILVGVMVTFGSHTALWLTRLLIERSKARRIARLKGGA